jgi:hypothetical protein
MHHHLSLGRIVILAVIAIVLFCGRGRIWPTGGSGPGGVSPA